MLTNQSIAPTEADGKFLQELALSDIAGEIAKLLREAYEVQGGQKPDFIESRALRAQADRLVASTRPGAKDDAKAAAKMAMVEAVRIVLQDAQKSYEDHSAALVIMDAMAKAYATIIRLGPDYILAAYDAGLERGR